MTGRRPMRGLQNAVGRTGHTVAEHSPIYALPGYRAAALQRICISSRVAAVIGHRFGAKFMERLPFRPHVSEALTPIRFRRRETRFHFDEGRRDRRYTGIRIPPRSGVGRLSARRPSYPPRRPSIVLVCRRPHSPRRDGDSCYGRFVSRIKIRCTGRPTTVSPRSDILFLIGTRSCELQATISAAAPIR